MILLSFLLSSFLAHAQSCPELSGKFRCEGGYQIQVQSYADAQGVHYRFQGPVEGSTELLANGEPQPIQSKIGVGTIRGFCAGGRLIADYALKSARGTRMIRDTMYMERKALVRIRQSGGRVNPRTQRLEFLKANAFVCRPVFDRPRG